MTHSGNYPSLKSRQQGAVLIVSLVILLILTLLGISSMQTTSMEERMAGNMRDRDLAFHAAEVALREGELALTGVVLPDFENTGGWYKAYYLNDNSITWENMAWSDASKVIAATAQIDQVDSQPAYYLEELPTSVSSGESLVVGFAPPPAAGNFRVTARGVGSSGTATVILQSTFRR